MLPLVVLEAVVVVQREHILLALELLSLEAVVGVLPMRLLKVQPALLAVGQEEQHQQQPVRQLQE